MVDFPFLYFLLNWNKCHYFTYWQGEEKFNKEGETQRNGCFALRSSLYRGADKSLARPGRKQARKHVRDECDFNNIETRAVNNFFFVSQDAEENSRHSDRNISLSPSWSD